jgi:hypothetical protein
MEQWCVISPFPMYSVSTYGRIRNDKTDRVLALMVNHEGVVHVGLRRNNTQYKRSVTVLVAKAFVPRPANENFDTPINLDGDRTNNHISNILWRPRWFAVDYFRQFLPGAPRGFMCPVEDMKTKERFETSFDAAVKYGLLDREILLATLNRTFVWPTYQMFRPLEEKDIGSQ